MSYDNRVFNVNGRGAAQLEMALELAFLQDSSICKGWKSSPSGLILTWCNGDGIVPFPSASGMTAKEVAPMVLSWLDGPDAKLVEFKDWDADCDHDGHNEMGWRVFCDGWGHVDGLWHAICCVRPAYIWFGK